MRFLRRTDHTELVQLDGSTPDRPALRCGCSTAAAVMEPSGHQARGAARRAVRRATPPTMKHWHTARSPAAGRFAARAPDGTTVSSSASTHKVWVTVATIGDILPMEGIVTGEALDAV